MANYPIPGNSEDVWGTDLVTFTTVSFEPSGADGGRLKTTALDGRNFTGTISMSGATLVALPTNTSIGAISATEISYLDNASSNIQTQITTHTSAASAHGTTTTIVGIGDVQTLINKTLTLPKINSTTSITASGGQLNILTNGNNADGLHTHTSEFITGEVDALYYSPNTFTDATILAAITAIGAASRVLLLRPGTWVISNDIIIPINIVLKVPKGAVMSVASTKTLTINSYFGEEAHQKFDGPGAIVFGAGSVKEQYLEWYGGAGDNATNNTPIWVKAIAAQASPAIRLIAGTYLGIVITGSKQVVITGESGNYNVGTILKNNSVSSALIDITGYNNGSKITNLTLDNNWVPNNTLRAYRCAYLRLYDLWVKNHGNETVANTFGIFLDASTSVEVGSINFIDMMTAGSLQSTFGGHFKAIDINGLNINHLASGRAGSDGSAIPYHFTACYGLTVNKLVQDGGGGGGLLYLQGVTGSTFNNIYAEITAENACVEDAWIRLNQCFGVSVSGFYLYHHESAGTVKPLFGLRDNRGLNIDTLDIRRTINNSAVPIMQWLDANNKNISISNIYCRNHINDAGSVPVAYNFIGNPGNYVSTRITLGNFYDPATTTAAPVTHSFVNVTGLKISNVNGNFDFNNNNGIIIENPSAPPIVAGAAFTAEGANSLFQEEQYYDIATGLTGASQVISLNLPANIQIIAVILRVNTLITGATSWTAACSGGATDNIGTGLAVAKNTKVYKIFGTAPITTGSTDITLTAAGGNFTAGEVGAVVRYRQVNTIPDAA